MYVRIAIILTFIITLCGSMAAVVQAQDDIREHRSCSICGMDRKAYGYSRMLIRYQDGSRTGVCSLHCAVSDIDAQKGRTTLSIQVADRDTQILIDADKSIWVMGGKKRGVMTQRPKWAFATEAAARSFIASHGGDIVSWEAAQAAAREELVR